MGKVIVIGSQKGGVGKTTTTLNLAYSLHSMGKKVLATDHDKSEIVSELKLGKSQGYDVIKKAQAFAKKLYNK